MELNVNLLLYALAGGVASTLTVLIAYQLSKLVNTTILVGSVVLLLGCGTMSFSCANNMAPSPRDVKVSDSPEVVAAAKADYEQRKAEYEATRQPIPGWLQFPAFLVMALGFAMISYPWAAWCHGWPPFNSYKYS